MITISKPLNSGKVQDYHKHQFTNSQENYYSQSNAIQGEWHGKLAEEMGLNGGVKSEDFALLSEGQDPRTGEQLVRHRMATEDSVGHRAAWDATFEAPKSVSITALVGGDDRVQEAHRQAVAKALDYMERHVHAHMGGNNAPEVTGKWAVATFEHDSARPVDGFAAPHLHTHAVFFNVTKTADGQAHALQEHNLFKVQSVATAIYQAELAYQLRQMGYELDAGKNGAPEIKGYSTEYLEANSLRSAQIRDRVQQLEEQGIIPANRTSEAEARELAAHASRAPKIHQSVEQIRATNKELAAQFGNQHNAVLAAAQRRAQEHSLVLDDKTTQAAASAALTYSRDKCFEQEAVVPERDLLRNALRRGQGVATFAHIEQALAQRRDERSLLTMKSNHNEHAYTTPEMVALEKKNIELMKAGRNQHHALASTLHQREMNTLNPNQREAATQLLSSRDTVQALQGAAGTGKTYTLTVVRKHLERSGYEVRGLAPTSRAAQQLAECGAECSTLQKHLARSAHTVPGEAHAKPVAYLVDETSLASTKQVNQLLAGLKPHDRVILIGDVRQHESVEAGRSFAQLQEHGIQTARLDQIVRQKDPALKEAVQDLANNKVADAIAKLKAQGRVTEIKNEDDRFRTIAAAYLKAPESSLVVSPDNRSRAAINTLIHAQLRQTNGLQGPDRGVTVYVNRQDMSGADRTWAANYHVGDVLRYNAGSQVYGLAPRSYATVTNVNTSLNEITVKNAAGTEVTYDPHRVSGVNAYRPEQRSFAVGDQIQFSSPYTAQKVANRELGKITALRANGDITVALDSRRTIKFNVHQFAHIDHGYAVTSHSSQGLTRDRVLANIDASRTNPSLINNRLAYVTVSRGKYDAHVYTNDASTLERVLSRDVSKSSAIAAPQQQQSQAQQQHHPPQHNQSHQNQPQHPVGNHTSHGQRLLTPDQAAQQMLPNQGSPQLPNQPQQAAAKQPHHGPQQHQPGAPNESLTPGHDNTAPGAKPDNTKAFEQDDGFDQGLGFTLDLGGGGLG